MYTPFRVLDVEYNQLVPPTMSESRSKVKRPFGSLSARQKRRRIENLLQTVDNEVPIIVSDCEKFGDDSELSEQPSSSADVYQGFDPEQVEQQQKSGKSNSSSDSEEPINCESAVGKIVYPELYANSSESQGQDKQSEVESGVSSECSRCEGNCSEHLKMCLSSWLTEEKNINEMAVGRLLKKLHPYFPMLPLSSSSLLSSNLKETNISIVPMGPGEYSHFDWIPCIRNIVESMPTETLQSLTDYKLDLLVNVDGLPLYKNSNKYTAYPILVSCLQIPDYVICVGIYCSNKDKRKAMPKDCDLLYRFINDIQSVSNILRTKKGDFKIQLGPFVCDAPVRSELKGIISHTGYNSYERCVQHGTYSHGHVILPKNNQPSRNDESFRNKSDINHHLENREVFLEALGYPMVSGFILDYMHMACLGLMKRCLLCWKTGKTSSNRIHFNSRSKEIFDVKCSHLTKFISSDFNRKCEGGLANVSNWKASEFRLFMLYLGIIILFDKEVASRDIFENFLLFSLSMKFLLSENNHNHLDFVKNMLIRFIEGAIDIYGSSFLSYNVHSIQHLTEDYQMYGNLEKISAFKFESYLGTNIKGAVRAGFKPLQQITRHVNNLNHKILTPKQDVFTLHKKDQNNASGVVSYKKLYYKSIFFVTKSGVRDNVIKLKDNSIAVIEDIFEKKNKIYLAVKCFRKVRNLFNEPLESRYIGIRVVSKLESPRNIPVSEMKCKAMLLPWKSKQVSFDLPHTNIN